MVNTAFKRYLLYLATSGRPKAERPMPIHGIVQKNPFTMSKRNAGQMPNASVSPRSEDHGKLVASSWYGMLVEPIGIEPMTSSLQS